MTYRIFFSAGEPSGDQHAAALLRSLRLKLGHVEAVGFGGACLAEAGCHLLADLTQHAVMGFFRPLARLPRFYAFYRRALAVFDRQPPQAVILVDYPGFNWHLARAAKMRKIPVCFYGPPQIWAWATWRVKKMRRLVDHAFCWLPFEAPWLQRHGCSASYVGHPFFDESAHRPHDESLVRQLTGEGRPVLTLLPGSRDQEVRANGPQMLRVAKRLGREIPDLQIVVAAFRPHQAELMSRWATEQGVNARVFFGKTPTLIQAATCCLAVSGSVSLELLYHEKPSVIVYCIGPLAERAEKFLRRVKYITLVNLLAYGRERAAQLGIDDRTTPSPQEALFPEFLTSRDVTGEIVGKLREWLTDASARESVIAQLRELKAWLNWEGAVDRAADAVADRLNLRPDTAALPRAA